MLFDTHLHLIYPDRLNYPWLKNIHSLNKPHNFASYQKIASRVGITEYLHMEVDVAENQIYEETALIAELMSNPEIELRGAISACRPETPEFPEFLEWAQTNPIIKGFRRVLHVVPNTLSQTTLFRDNIKRLTGTGLTFDICVSYNQLDLAIALVDHCPEVDFILDHCGVPDIKGGEIKVWSKSLTELAKRKNILAKISGLIAYGDHQTWTLDNIRPYFEHTVTAFGHKRIIWGSDSPVCNLGGGLETLVAATYSITSDWDKKDKLAFFSGNAKSLWRL